MKNVKKSFRKTEVFLFILGLLIAILLAALLPLLHHYEWEGLLGYFIGCISFLITLESLLQLVNKSRIPKVGFIFFINFKLVFIFALFYTLRLIGIPVLNLVIGFLACQTTAVFALSVITLRSNKELQASEQTLTASNKI